MLSYGCAGEVQLLRPLWKTNKDTTDTITSNSPTLPVNIDKMQKMIEIVKNAKGMPTYITELKCH
jgi:hypothetical protein